MLINLSNHPINQWSVKQLNSAKKKYVKIVDIPFPAINPGANSTEITDKAELYNKKCLTILKKSTDKNNAVHIMGELTFTYALVRILKENSITCIASATARNVIQTKTHKNSIFEFVRFREYK